MTDCNVCQRTDVKCCYTCQKDTDKCEVYHKCGSDCPEHESRVITNADKIRSMNNAELAEFINGIDRYDDYAILINGDTVIDMTSCILDWLQSEAE